MHQEVLFEVGVVMKVSLEERNYDWILVVIDGV